MSRVTSGKVTHARHKKVLSKAKGYYGRRKNAFRTATQAVDKANQYATRDRKVLAQTIAEPWLCMQCRVRRVQSECFCAMASTIDWGSLVPGLLLQAASDSNRARGARQRFFMGGLQLAR